MVSPPSRSRNEPLRSILDALGLLIGGMWAMFLLQQLTGWFSPWGSITQFGLVPRVWTSLIPGTLMMPLLHGNWEHLTSNTIALAPLIPFFFLSHRRAGEAWGRLAVLWIASGVVLWIIGPANTLNIGASALIYAMTSYLVVFGLRGGHWIASVVAVLVILFQVGAFVSGLLPREPGVSYAGHWSGLLVGVGLGFAVRLPR